MRQPFALANWKMAMTIEESRAFVAEFLAAARDVLGRVEVVLCPPYTALAAVAQALGAEPVAVGAQNVAAHEAPEYTGEVSAALLAEAGCRWVLLGHWEVRRHLGDDDALVNRKLHLALERGLRAVLLVGEAAGREARAPGDLERQLAAGLAGASPAQVGRMVFLYEPEPAMGAAAPLPVAQVAAGCRAIRSWLRDHHGQQAAEAARVVYGGSVGPQHASELLRAPDVDGLGAGRLGRDPRAWAAIVRLIAEARVSEPQDSARI